MYFDFEDYRPDINPVGRAISWREGILLSIIFHMAVLLVAVSWPQLFPYDPTAARAVELARDEQRGDQPRFVFVQPRVDTPAARPPERGELSDRDRQARTPERLQAPANMLPFSRGNTPERVERTARDAAAGRGPDPEAARPQPAETARDTQGEQKLPESQTALQLTSNRLPDRPLGQRPVSGGSLGEALRNLQRYVERDQFENPQGGAGAFGPAIQFDTKGVEFGPWIRRFVAQVKGNWMIPYTTLMSMQGHVVITFNVHKNGAITDLAIVGPSTVEAFNNSAFGALTASNPTQPLPPEYPADRAFFTVTFFYNETPP